MFNTFVSQVLQNCRIHPEKPALSFVERPTLSYGLLERHIAGVYRLLQSHGVGKGTPVVLAASRGPGFIFAYTALQALGALVSPVDPQTPGARLAYIRETLGARLTFWPGALYDSEDAALLDEVTSDAPLPDTVPSLEESADVMFTSGTTGASKGVLLTHGNLACAIAHINTYVGNGPDDVELCPMPLSHSFGLARMRCILSMGGHMVVVDGITPPKRLFSMMEQHHVSGLGMVGPAWTLLYKLSGSRISRFKDQLRYLELGSAAMQPEEKKRLAELLPTTHVVMHYGLTEASRAAFLDFHNEEDKLNTVGKAGPYSELCIGDEGGIRLPAGEEGEICVRGSMVSRGYINAPSCFTPDGFFRTGDLGRMDVDGYVTIIGRIKEMINVGGEKVTPAEVEKVLNALPGIAESACVAMPDPILGEAVAAFLVPEPGASMPVLQTILPMLAGKLEKFKQPKRLYRIDALPRTVSGKLQRNALKEYL